MTKTLEMGKPEKRGTGWFVPLGQVGYFVQRVEGRWRCTCPNFRWRKTGTCNSIIKFFVLDGLPR